MAVDFTVQMITATVALEQPLPGDRKWSGGGFLVSAPDPGGAPRTVLVTARHVFAGMAGDEARMSLRFEGADRRWSLRWQGFPCARRRHPLWTEHPSADVAVMTVSVPPDIARTAIPLAWLAQADTFDRDDVGPGDEMVTLGFPCGYSANRIGFPILRAGRVASYPLTPVADFPTFLLDFTVMPGNSGGPVFMPHDARRRSGAEGRTRPFVAGVLTQSSERLDLGFITHAQFVREAIARMDEVGPWVRPAQPTAPPALGAPAAVTAC